MIAKLLNFLFKAEKIENKIQTDLIAAIRAKMETKPDESGIEYTMWRVGGVSIVQIRNYNLRTIAVVRYDPYRNMEILMSWIEVEGQITKMDRKEFTAEDLVMHALS